MNVTTFTLSWLQLQGDENSPTKNSEQECTRKKKPSSLLNEINVNGGKFIDDENNDYRYKTSILKQQRKLLTFTLMIMTEFIIL